jgi:hypothetical protein
VTTQYHQPPPSANQTVRICFLPVGHC